LAKWSELLLETLMIFTSCCRGVVLFVLILALTGPALAGEPTDQLKVTIDKVIAILNDPDFKEPEKADERRKLLRRAADERFDWHEMTRRTLARHWKNRTDDEKKDFVPLFADLLERTYMNRVENYSGEKVIYNGEKIKGKYCLVSVTVFTSKNVEIPVQYRLQRKGDEWLIYDVSIEGVSLVNNYRTQFNSIILNSSYEGLVEKLREKVASN
jgi:phospholipid transport system substrate-binding protein